MATGSAGPLGTCPRSLITHSHWAASLQIEGHGELCVKQTGMAECLSPSKKDAMSPHLLALTVNLPRALIKPDVFLHLILLVLSMTTSAMATTEPPQWPPHSP